MCQCLCKLGCSLSCSSCSVPGISGPGPCLARQPAEALPARQPLLPRTPHYKPSGCIHTPCLLRCEDGEEADVASGVWLAPAGSAGRQRQGQGVLARARQSVAR
jgi:hypothetical protein